MSAGPMKSFMMDEIVFESLDHERARRVLDAAMGLGSSATATERLTKEFGEELARWAVGQWELRGRAAGKFELAEEMVFTRAGLEMATHERVADWHAGLFPNGVEVLDATCGIGADLIALARRGPVTGLDLAEDHVDCARWNLAVHGLSGQVVCRDAISFVRDEHPPYVFIDPARRVGDRRLTQPEDFSPSLADMIPLLNNCERAVVKLSPMLDDGFLQSLGGELWFVSYGRECREAVVVLGRSARAGLRRAVRVETGSILEPAGVGRVMEEAGRFVYDPDPAAIRGHCLGSFGLAGLGTDRGYLTGENQVESEWLRAYQTVWQGAWREKVVRAALREFGATVKVVKTRGIKDDAASVLKGMKGFGDRGLVLLLFRSGKRERAVLAVDLA